MPPTTLKELAILLNLAPSTVSRALHGHPDISKATQKRVKALARQLQYHPSIMATGLRNRTFKLLAVVVPHLTEFLYIAALQGILKHASEKTTGYYFTKVRKMFKKKQTYVIPWKNQA